MSRLDDQVNQIDINNTQVTKNKNTSFTIRPSKLSEVQEIREVKCDSFQEEMTKYNLDPKVFVSQAGIAEEIRRIKNEDGKYLNYVVLLEDKIVGGCTIVNEGNEQYYVQNMNVSMTHQNEGIGGLIFEFLFREFPNAKLWHLETPYLSYRNHHFYEKAGFVKIGETKPDENGFYLFEYEKRS